MQIRRGRTARGGEADGGPMANFHRDRVRFPLSDSAAPPGESSPTKVSYASRATRAARGAVGAGLVWPDEYAAEPRRRQCASITPRSARGYLPAM